MKSYNPDVLSCLANLSNDEVFTPPVVANKMLDMLPAELWKDSHAKFLDPVCKTGVFLREIAKRLMDGLVEEIPDVQERADHIFTEQLYGIAITELTSLLSRRSVYCSKAANSKYSICTKFQNEEGNIHYERMQHTWNGGKCIYCGANKSVYDRGDEMESHAYQFIHIENPNDLFKNMNFDVIIGNPPYQLNDGGGMGTSAMPIYQKFVEQAKKLSPKYLSMIIPARWYSGGRGLDNFRNEMLHDNRIRILNDYLDASDCFPRRRNKGGVCYFLWERDNRGPCHIITHNNKIIESERYLLEKGIDVFIRSNESIKILRKVQTFSEQSFSYLISANDPFGFDVREEGSYKRIRPIFQTRTFENSVKFYYNGWRKDGIGYINRNSIKKNIDWVDQYKVLIPKAWGKGDAEIDFLKPFLIERGSCCTETYLVVGPFTTKELAENVISYMKTKFFHMLVSLIKITQNSMKKVYSFVPVQNFRESWTDEKLYKKYGLTEEETTFIESMVRPRE